MTIFHAVVEMVDGSKESVILNAVNSKAAKIRSMQGLIQDGYSVKKVSSAKAISEAQAGKLQDEGVRCWATI